MSGIPEDANLYVIPAVNQTITPNDLLNQLDPVVQTTSGADVAQVLIEYPIDPELVVKPYINLAYEQNFDISGAAAFAFQFYIAADDSSYNPASFSRVYSSLETAGNTCQVWNPVLISNVDYTASSTTFQIGISADGFGIVSVSLADATNIAGSSVLSYP